ncbi:hypothetical protein LINPERPRIM_LOCUS19958 [Linum perenne]
MDHFILLDESTLLSYDLSLYIHPSSHTQSNMHVLLYINLFLLFSWCYQSMHFGSIIFALMLEIALWNKKM